MNYKKIYKEYHKVGASITNLDFSNKKSKFGILYTSYIDKYNLIEVGFAENHRILETKLSKNQSILLDKNKGQTQDLFLLKETLYELGIKLTGESYYVYSNILIRHLSTLGWPVGNSLYKQRKIKKELSYA